ncbi:galactokinase [uncultured Tenacibaculum sp.]|uniref:galactokinase n=1 Tax=uncultured Tenacibaculum sp. TaxID=174713 RepID=UPI002631A3F0|nr:galactokinase [uncultured Tenacibaculum sp.]
MNQSVKEQVQQEFLNYFKIEPLLIFSPGRINLIGEHTDYNEGYVFPAAIDKGIYTAIQQSKTDKSTLVALDKNEQYEFTTNSISPLTTNGWQNYILGVVSEIQKKGKTIPNFNLVFSGDIPFGAGLSSSAALENSVVFGLNELLQLQLTKHEMIFISQKAEHNFVGVKCGIMDQYASMFGQKNKAMHLDCKTLEATIHSAAFEGYEFILINTNVKHSLADSAYNKRRAVCENISKLLNKPSLRDVKDHDLNTIKDKISLEEYEQALYVIQENKRTLQAVKALEIDNVSNFGNLLFESHKGLSEQYNVSCLELDFLVINAQKNPAVIGARMMGGGFGGCTINLIKTSKKGAFLTQIQQEYAQEFKQNCAIYEVNLSNGTQII